MFTETLSENLIEAYPFNLSQKHTNETIQHRKVIPRRHLRGPDSLHDNGRDGAEKVTNQVSDTRHDNCHISHFQTRKFPSVMLPET